LQWRTYFEHSFSTNKVPFGGKQYFNIGNKRRNKLQLCHWTQSVIGRKFKKSPTQWQFRSDEAGSDLGDPREGRLRREKKHQRRREKKEEK